MSTSPRTGAPRPVDGATWTGLLALALSACLVALDAIDTARSIATSGSVFSEASARGRGGGNGGGQGNRGERDGDRDGGRNDRSEKGGDGNRSQSDGRRDGSNSSQERSSDRGSGNDGRGDRRSKGREREDDSGRSDDPPRTLVETFDRLFKSTPAAAPAQSKSSPASRSGSLDSPATDGRSHRGDEVLARNLSGQALQKAKDLGFAIASTSSLSHTSSTVSRLIVPPGMAAADALHMLQNTISREGFGLNHIYRMYRTAKVGSDHEASRIQLASRPGEAVPCRGDRCSGRSLIGWQHQLGSCSAGLRVAMIDTDVDYEHPAFESQKLRSGTFTPQGARPAPKWHGTAVLALLAGNERSGTPGLIPHAEFYVAGAFFTETDGSFATDTDSVLRALEWISAFDVQVVNMSFAGPKDELMQRSIAKLADKGVVFVAAGGNEGPSAPPAYPAAFKQVIAVTAVNRDLRNFAFANRGSHIDVSSPGVEIWTAVPGAREGYYSGTSFAAPFATAIIATIYANSRRRDKESLLAALELKDLGAPGRDPVYGRGLLVAPLGCQMSMASNPAPSVAAATPKSPPAQDARGSSAAPRPSNVSLGFK